MKKAVVGLAFVLVVAIVVGVLLHRSGCSVCFGMSDHSAADCAAVVDHQLQEVKCYDPQGTLLVDRRTMGVMRNSPGTSSVFRDADTGQVVRTTERCVVTDVLAGAPELVQYGRDGAR